MLEKIEVRPQDGWKRWKQDTSVQPGPYYKVGIRSPDDKTKKRLGLIAACSNTVRFAWLAPQEEWIRRVLLGQFDLPPRRPAVSVDWSLVGLVPSMLRDWQRNLIELAWADLEQRRKSVLAVIASLGAGKTLAGLGLCQLGEYAVVFVREYLHAEWRAEAHKFGLLCPDIYTYESAHRVKKQPDVVIVDEVLALKSPETLRHRRIAEIAKGASVVYGCTGTPTGGGGGPLDYRWLRALWGGVFPESDNTIKHLFGVDTQLKEVAPGRNVYVTETWDSKAAAQFVAPYIISVDTSYMTEHLDPQTKFIKVSMNRSDYELIRKGAATSRNHSKRHAQVLQCTDGFIINDNNEVVPLRENPKFDALEGFVDTLGEPCVVYARWRESVNDLAKRFAHLNPAVVSGDGSMNSMEVERFKRGETSMLIANAAYSEGMNLQHVCRTMIWVSLSSSPKDLIQAKGRINRPGQTRQPIYVFFQVENTLDERIYELVTKHVDFSDEQIDALLESEIKA